jgi:hypothetical protein
MATFADGRETSVCKIYQIGTIFLGVGGLDHDPVTKFSVSEIVFTATRNVRGFRNKMTFAARAIRPKLLIEARNMLAARPNEFEHAEANGVKIMLIGFEKGTPFVVGQQFTISVTSKHTVQVTPGKPISCPGADCPTGVYVLHLGAAEVIEQYSAAHPAFSSSADLARNLVQLEIDAHAPGVGGPIDVLRVSASGPQWIQQKPGCPIEIKPKLFATPIGRAATKRRNLSVRMTNRRCARLTNAFSKAIGHHVASVAIEYLAYNFIKIHRTLRTTPAMAAGVTDRLWDVNNLVALWEAEENQERAA